MKRTGRRLPLLLRELTQACVRVCVWKCGGVVRGLWNFGNEYENTAATRTRTRETHRPATSTSLSFKFTYVNAKDYVHCFAAWCRHRYAFLRDFKGILIAQRVAVFARSPPQCISFIKLCAFIFIQNYRPPPPPYHIARWAMQNGSKATVSSNCRADVLCNE